MVTHDDRAAPHEQQSPEENDEQKAAAATVGAASGGIVGAVLAGPPGAIVGAATGTLRGVVAKEAADKVNERRDEPPDVRRATEDGATDRVVDEALDAGRTLKREVTGES
jgi:outer membrane lipoprotein SlyB